MADDEPPSIEEEYIFKDNDKCLGAYNPHCLTIDTEDIYMKDTYPYGLHHKVECNEITIQTR